MYTGTNMNVHGVRAHGAAATLAVLLCSQGASSQTTAAYWSITDDLWGRPNIADGHTATASSIWRSGFGPDAALDERVPVQLNSVIYCFHSDRQQNPWWEVDLGQNRRIGNVSVVGRTHQTNQGDNLQLTVRQSGATTNQTCGGPGAIFHTNGQGGQVYTRHHNDSTAIVPCNLYGRYIRITSIETNDYLVFCECVVTEADSVAPTVAPTAAPTVAPTVAPTTAPTNAPTNAPTTAPTTAPTATPTTATPTYNPTVSPTALPTDAPTRIPTASPTSRPTAAPVAAPTAAPMAASSSTGTLGDIGDSTTLYIIIVIVVAVAIIVVVAVVSRSRGGGSGNPAEAKTVAFSNPMYETSTSNEPTGFDDADGDTGYMDVHE